MDSDFRVLEPMESETYRDYARRVLFENIVNIHMPPGAVIDEAEIAQRLGISRTPVHEAVKSLSGAGLVDGEPSRATRVSRIDYRLISDGIFLRSCLEPNIIESLRGRLSSAQIQRLLDVLQVQRRAIDTQDFYLYNSADDSFHYMLYEFANCNVLIGLLRKQLVPFSRYRTLIYLLTSKYSYLGKSYVDHEKLFYTLTLSCDLPEPTPQFIKHHIMDGLKEFHKLFAMKEEYFTGFDSATAISELEREIAEMNRIAFAPAVDQ